MGVSINIFIKHLQKSNALGKVYHYDLWGLREEKNNFLIDSFLGDIKFNEIKLIEPHYFFVPMNLGNNNYNEWFSVKELFSTNNVGIVTARDDFTIHFSKDDVRKTINEFLTLDDDTARERFNLGKDVRDWKIGFARSDLKKTFPKKGAFIKMFYRPFDSRWTFYTGNSRGFYCYPRHDVMQHMLKDNISLVSCRNQNFSTSALVSNSISGSRYFSNPGSLGIDYVFPLYLYSGRKRRPNLNPKIMGEIEAKLNLSFVPEKGDNLTLAADGFKDGSFSSGQLVENSFCPLDLFDYIYAVLHSPIYRETYREFLKIDFPRIPYPADKKTFWKLAELGGELRRLHLLEGKEFERIEADSAPCEKVTVGKVRYSEGKVFVNDDFCFVDVPLSAWEFYIGGYQPAQKWLKDRKGCILKGDDLKHYRKIVLALTETAWIMGEINGVGVV
jgi:predicted helicase